MTKAMSCAFGLCPVMEAGMKFGKTHLLLFDVDSYHYTNHQEQLDELCPKMV